MADDDPNVSGDTPAADTTSVDANGDNSGSTDIANFMTGGEATSSTGSVSFYWGTPGRGPKFRHGGGLAHIDAKHGRDVLEMMPEVIAKGDIVEHQYAGQPGERIRIEYQGQSAILSLWKEGGRETWLLTGWDNYPAPGLEGNSEGGSR